MSESRRVEQAGLVAGCYAEVPWLDSAGCDERFVLDKPDDIAAIRLISVGYVVANGDEGITLCMDRWVARGSRHGRNWLTIPHCSVLDVRKLA